MPHFCHLQAFQAGIVWVNCAQPTFCQAPWGGKKRSGFGRELGEWYDLISHLSKTKIIMRIDIFHQMASPDLSNSDVEICLAILVDGNENAFVTYLLFSFQQGTR